MAGCCRCSLNRAADWLDPINAALDAFGIDTPVRVAAFLAQIGHESGYLQWTRELWGPTEQQLRYEPPSTLARELGNTFPGDGRLYRGAGLIETTGRANFARTRDGDYTRSGYTQDKGSFLGDASIGVAYRKGDMQTSFGVVYREIDAGKGLRGMNGLDTDVSEGLLAFQLSIRPGR